MASVNDSGMSLLEQAEELLRAGKRQAALPLLAEYLQGHPNSARGWWMLSLAVTDLRASPLLWLPAGTARTGTGAALQFALTNTLPFQAYGAAVRVP